MAKRPKTLTQQCIELVWYVRGRTYVTPPMTALAEQLLPQLKALDKQERFDAKMRPAKVELGKRKLVIPPPIKHK